MWNWTLICSRTHNICFDNLPLTHGLHTAHGGPAVDIQTPTAESKTVPTRSPLSFFTVPSLVPTDFPSHSSKNVEISDIFFLFSLSHLSRRLRRSTRLWVNPTQRPSISCEYHTVQSADSNSAICTVIWEAFIHWLKKARRTFILRSNGAFKT